MENLQVQLIRPPVLVRHYPNRRVSVRPAQRRAHAFFAFHILSNRVLQLFFKHIWQLADLEDPGGFGFFVGFLIPVLGSRVNAQTVGRLQDRNLLSPIPSIALGTGRRPASGMRVPGRPPELACRVRDDSYHCSAVCQPAGRSLAPPGTRAGTSAAAFPETLPTVRTGRSCFRLPIGWPRTPVYLSPGVVHYLRGSHRGWGGGPVGSGVTGRPERRSALLRSHGGLVVGFGHTVDTAHGGLSLPLGKRPTKVKATESHAAPAAHSHRRLAAFVADHIYSAPFISNQQ